MQTYSRSVYITLFEILPIWACFFSNSNKFNVFILFIELCTVYHYWIYPVYYMGPQCF